MFQTVWTPDLGFLAWFGLLWRNRALTSALLLRSHPFLIPLFIIVLGLPQTPIFLPVRIAAELAAVAVVWSILSLPCMRYCCNVCVEPPIERCFRVEMDDEERGGVKNMAGRPKMAG